MKNKLILSIALVCVFNMLDTQTLAKMSAQSNKLYNNAILQEQEGNYSQALNYILKAIQYSPDDAVLNIKLAGIYTNLGRYKEASDAYKKAILLRPQDGFLYISLANLYMLQYDYKNALDCYQKASSLIGEYKYNLINIANAKSLLGDSKGAISAYEEFLGSYPNNLEAQVGIANIYLDEKKYDKSIEYFALALRQNPGDFRDYPNYGLALLRNNDYEKAEIAFKSAITLNKNDAMSFANLAISQMKQGKNNDAILSFKKALELDGDLDSVRYDYANVLALENKTDSAVEQYKIFIEKYPKQKAPYSALAVLYAKQNDYSSAIGVLESAVSIFNDDTNLKIQLAQMYQNNAEFNDALKYYNEVLLSDKTNPVALYNCAIIYSQIGKNNQAKDIFSYLMKSDETVLEQNKIYVSDILDDAFDNELMIAKGLFDNGEYRKAKSIYLALAQKRPDDHRVFLGLADCAFALKMYTFAKDYYEKAIQIDNTNQNALIRYSQVLYELKDYDIALGVLDKAIENDPGDDKLYYNKSLIYYQTKKNDPAVENIKKALEINASNSDYHYLFGLILEESNNLKDAIFAYEKAIELSDNEKFKTELQDKTKKLYDELVKQ